MIRKGCYLLACVFLFSPQSGLPRSNGKGAPDTPLELLPQVEPDADLPEGFCETVVATGLNGVTAMEIAPDGRIFVCEQTGTLRVIKNDRLLPEPFLKPKVDSFWERGLIGVTLDPDFPKNPYVYVCYVSPDPYPHHRISRFTAKGDVAQPDSEVILLEGDDQRKLGGAQPAGHQGGAIHFGKDGKLYIAIGEQTAGAPAQKMDTFQGKLLRINADGSIPADNPFFKTAQGKYRAIWALGLRNPFAFAVQPGTGRMLINDVGDARWEEINEGKAGANYGWPDSEGPTANPKHVTPLYAYDHSIGRSITGGAFYNPAHPSFPPEYVGKYFFVDYIDNWIRLLDPDDPKSVSLFGTGLAGPVDVKVSLDGSLYVLNRRMWVKDDNYKEATGSLHKITYQAQGDKRVPRITRQPSDLFAILGQTVSVEVVAQGESPLKYQWLKNGKPIADGQSAKCTLANVRKDDAGKEYRCVISNKYGRTKSVRARLDVVSPLSSQDPAHLIPGLGGSLYEGSFDSLPIFGELKPARTATVKGLEMPADWSAKGRAAVFKGFIDIQADGAYTFYLTANGPSKLFIASQEIAGLGRQNHNRESHGSVGLKAGKHAFILLHVQGSNDPSLSLAYSGPNVVKQAIPQGRFFHVDPAVLSPPRFSRNGGEYSGPVTVKLETSTEDAVLHYTLDGTEPTRGSPVYSEPLRIDRSATLSAMTFTKDGKEKSAVSQAVFNISGNKPFGLPERQPVTTLNVPRDPADLPPLLSQTGVFRSLKDLTPNPGIIPYEVNAALWSDNAYKRRWIAVPGMAQIGFAETGEWAFPPGTVFIKHFEMTLDSAKPEIRRPLETRLLVVGKAGGGYGATYKWRPDHSDADLLFGEVVENLKIKQGNDARTLAWHYPSRTDCLMCHTSQAGFVLGVKTRQLNGDMVYVQTGITDNQLRTLNHLRLFTAPLPETNIPTYSKLVALTDSRASVEQRARSYLDANCASCHRPGVARAEFDARYDTPLAKQNLIHGKLIAADLGIAEAEVLKPGDPEHSMIFQRMKRRHDAFNMPPLASQIPDKEALKVLEEWIKGLPRK